ncbi:APC membrane recruitment protein 2 isoform X1 [Phycodurus eques]|uniref:APC membrane recruitment protein 2 isoform X1 n=1 Tax=Phycodurus eques TaxID=693459 RepID=UPI002ACE1462|nr:APC membrane recruitment protein 2 isoform X1 [Phycodurus eques]
MEVQTECADPSAAPPCDPRPTGKINKAAFKLFGKRRAGSGMASFFSFRNKGATLSRTNGHSDTGNSVNGNGSMSSVELVRSKTHDGLTGSINDADGQRGEGLSVLETGTVRSLSKSLSFFSLLRRGSLKSSENGAGLVRRGRGLKGFFSSLRWRRKDKTNEGDGEELEPQKEKDVDIADPETAKDVALTLDPTAHYHQEDHGKTEAECNLQAAEAHATSVSLTPTHCVVVPGPSGEPDSPSPYTPGDSPLYPATSKAKASVSSLSPSLATPPLECCSTADPPSEPSVDRLCSLLFNDVTSLKSFDSLTGCGDIIADADEETAGNGGSGTSSSSSGGGGGGSVGGSGVGRPLGATCAANRGSPSKAPLSSTLTQPLFTSSSGPASVPARAAVPSTPQPPPVGSGVVAYMGGGEEMASPEGVDDADMQGLWHMLPSTGDNSPALPRAHQPSCTTPTSTYPLRTLNSASCHQPSTNVCVDRKTLQVKSLGLSKIPVVGGAGSRATKSLLPHGRHPTSPGDKEPLSDEGYWDTPSATPTATPEESGLRQRHNMSRDSCSGDHLYDLYNDPEGPVDDDDQNSSSSLSTEYKLSPPSSSSSSSFRSIKGSASLPRESKIPVSARQTTPPQSASQSALSSVLESESSLPKTQAPPPARTRIPVSKVPVRRSVNKPGPATRASKK